MRKPIKLEVIAIVHGQSEYKLCQSIKSNLRLKHEIISRDKGKHSIQVTGVMDILNDSRFRTLNAFKREFPDVAVEKRKLINFKLFIIMDVDDCTEIQKNKYITKELFQGHWLADYIVPIYNEPDLEATMNSINIEIQKKKDYITIFPTNHGDLNMEMAKELGSKLKKCPCSNLYEYIQYCIEIAEKNADLNHF